MKFTQKSICVTMKNYHIYKINNFEGHKGEGRDVGTLISEIQIHRILDLVYRLVGGVLRTNFMNSFLREQSYVSKVYKSSLSPS